MLRASSAVAVRLAGARTRYSDAVDNRALGLPAEDQMPLKSKAQERFLRAAEARGDVKAGTAQKFRDETPKRKFETLPEHLTAVKDSPGGKRAAPKGKR